jgi:hypothetical protein
MIKSVIYLAILVILSGLFYFCVDLFQKRDERLAMANYQMGITECNNAAIEAENAFIKSLTDKLEYYKAREEKSRKRAEASDNKIKDIKQRNKDLYADYKKQNDTTFCAFGVPFTRMLNEQTSNKPENVH